mgnify:CR=1 FL=1
MMLFLVTVLLLAAVLYALFNPGVLVPFYYETVNSLSRQDGIMFQRINATDAEKIFVIQQNIAGATIPVNGTVAWDIATADGVRIAVPVASTLSSIVGVANAAIADSARGLIQTYGYRASAVCINHTSVPVVAGDILIPVTAVTYLARSGVADGKSGFITAAAAIATGSATTVNAPVFIRCM